MIKIDKELIKMYAEKVTKASFNNQQSMLKYFKSKIDFVIKLSDGRYFAFEKPAIETRFCVSYDECVEGSIKNAHEKSESFYKSKVFIKENLKALERDLSDLEELKEQDVYSLPKYGDQGDISGVIVDSDRIEYITKPDLLNKLTKEDIDLVIEAKKLQIERFTKRLNTYLNKFGTTKVYTWTYSI